MRGSLLLLTAGAAGLSAIANAVSAPPEQTRMGAAIKQDMAARDRATAQRNRVLGLREQAALAAEQRLKATASAQAAPAAGQQATQADPEEERYAELARIYQAMKPKAAALVMEQLAMDVQVEVAQRMRERSAALVMAAMTPKGAAALTMGMARRNKDRPGWTALEAK